jgi:YD repeat-containing protein
MSESTGGNDRITFTYDEITENGIKFARTNATNALGKTTRYVFDTYFDATRRLVRVDGDVSANCAASTGSFTWTLIGECEHLASHTDNEVRVTSYIRDAFGRPTTITEGTGAEQRRSLQNPHRSD